jgi:prepilin-type N-terminal cleavage/methylation domain-containing protein
MIQINSTNTNVKTRGFTLIEMSIVLVVIALIIGAILGGAGIIKRAKAINVVSDIHQFTTATDIFYEKYRALPGDYSLAIDQWGTATQNGNENGRIEASESLRAWQQLSLANVLNENYTGTGTVSLGKNIPKSDFDGAGYKLQYIGTPYNDNFIILTTTSDGFPLKPADGFYVDKELDDGLPNEGKIYGIGAGTDLCTLATEYNMKHQEKACKIYVTVDPMRFEY